VGFFYSKTFYLYNGMQPTSKQIISHLTCRFSDLSQQSAAVNWKAMLAYTHKTARALSVEYVLKPASDLPLEYMR